MVHWMPYGHSANDFFELTVSDHLVFCNYVHSYDSSKQMLHGIARRDPRIDSSISPGSLVRYQRAQYGQQKGLCLCNLTTGMH